ncbi:hypothetical protein UB23_01200 [Pseudomonas sp. ES3-33]|nr:hypothetical protein UB23_01200 [Pseudomonas sp. ES3-33]
MTKSERDACRPDQTAQLRQWPAAPTSPESKKLMELKIAVSNLVISRIRQQDNIKYGRSHDIEQYKGRVIDM